MSFHENEPEDEVHRDYPPASMTEPTEQGLHELAEKATLCRLCVRRIYETCPLEPSENVAVCTEYAPFGGTPKAAGVVWVPSSDCTCPWKYCGETDRDENPPDPCSFGHRPVPRVSAPATCPTCGHPKAEGRCPDCGGLRIDAGTERVLAHDLATMHATPTPISEALAVFAHEDAWLATGEAKDKYATVALVRTLVSAGATLEAAIREKDQRIEQLEQEAAGESV